MSRVIKFRHWCPESQEMTPFEKIRLLPTDSMFCHLFQPDMLGGVLMQFTGLIDRNGVAIYEGDIIPCKVGVQQYSNWVVGDEDATLNGVVEWNEHQLCWQIGFKQPNKYGIISSHFGWGSSPIIAVIGNTHQNHTLL